MLLKLINADSFLNFPDFRAHERAFQLIQQVVGRAGRNEKQGKAFIQTYNPNHPVLQQINDNNLISFIKSKIEAKNAHLLELEVTENVLITNYEKVSAFLTEIKGHGISISVDDFGTGYCSLAYLKHLPIDTLKIDRSFIKDLDNNTDDGAIVSAIIALAQKLNLVVIAEGIENTAQEKFLIDNNCIKAQGFLYSKPVPLHEFKVLMTQNMEQVSS